MGISFSIHQSQAVGSGGGGLGCEHSNEHRGDCREVKFPMDRELPLKQRRPTRSLHRTADAAVEVHHCAASNDERFERPWKHKSDRMQPAIQPKENLVVNVLRVSLFLGLVLWSNTAGAAISKEELLQLVEKNVDPSLILSLVQKQCVGFDITPEVLLELSGKVPKEVLQAAIDCKSPADSKGTVSQAIGLSSAPAFDLAAVQTVAVIPLTLDGQVDDALTGVLVEELRLQKPRYKLIDPVEIAVHFEDKGSFNSSAPIKSLLAAARTVGAQAVLVGGGSSYRRFDDPAIRLDLKLVEVNQGKVLWSGGEKGISNFYSWQTAKKNAARNTVKILP